MNHATSKSAIELHCINGNNCQDYFTNKSPTMLEKSEELRTGICKKCDDFKKFPQTTGFWYKVL